MDDFLKLSQYGRHCEFADKSSVQLGCQPVKVVKSQPKGICNLLFEALKSN